MPIENKDDKEGWILTKIIWCPIELWNGSLHKCTCHTSTVVGDQEIIVTQEYRPVETVNQYVFSW